MEFSTVRSYASGGGGGVAKKSRSGATEGLGGEQYATKVKDNIEAYLAKLRKGKFVVREYQSQSIAAARECAGILRAVVELYHEAETQPQSKSVQSLLHDAPAIEVTTEQVSTILRHVTRAGSAMQRGPYFKLLLTNVTRRVLSILRQAAAESVGSESELEAIAKIIIDDARATLGSSVDESEVEEDSSFEVVQQATPPKEVQSGSSDDGSDDDDNNRHGDHSDDDDVQMETSAIATNNFLKVEAAQQQKQQREQQQQKPKGMKRTTFSLADDSSSSAQKSKPMALGGLTRQQSSDNDDHHGHEHQPSSLLSDFMVSTPPKNVLPRAPSILGEVDVLKEKTYAVRFEEFIQRSIDGIRSFEGELAYVTQELCKRAARQLHPLDTVITIGSSHSTLNFLLKATEDYAKLGTMFKVIVLEGRPLRGAHRLADALRERGVEVRVLPDSSAFAVMSTCTKVVIGVENVLANGGLLAPIGTHPLCIAAQHFSVPVMVVTMTLKMTPYYPSDTRCTSLVKISRTRSEELPWSTFAFPGDVLAMDEWAAMDVDPKLQPIDVTNPLMEYVPPHLVSVFATNEGEYTVPQIHRIVRDNYNNEDAHL
ncbi:translation initiation factor Elf2b, putative [Bodo saltans]|uniref:Translation initiation factor eIF2B subunit beta n=1 Tax=Bodo saltans TaxID=75058 RepID=A0A0S4JL98_BODSA|nr:translation initiation factor Elf2b, putative [Bodo saltans]|eukprot:CUG90908.1 translation initiation factor Elf2b, putative [Bodo saltans]